MKCPFCNNKLTGKNTIEYTQFKCLNYDCLFLNWSRCVIIFKFNEIFAYEFYINNKDKVYYFKGTNYGTSIITIRGECIFYVENFIKVQLNEDDINKKFNRLLNLKTFL